MKRILPFIFAALFACAYTHGQNIELSPTVIASAGNYSEAGTISLSWTLGEVAVTTLTQGDIILTQGFQQSFLTDVGFAAVPIRWQITAYPNPVRDELRVRFDLPETTEFFIEMQDVHGRLVSQEQYKQVFPGDVIQFEMSPYNPGVYFFRVSTTNRTQVRVISITKL
jgi:hypothetical protein